MKSILMLLNQYSSTPISRPKQTNKKSWNTVYVLNCIIHESEQVVLIILTKIYHQGGGTRTREDSTKHHIPSWWNKTIQPEGAL